MFSKSDVRRWSRRQMASPGKPLPLAGRLALLAGLLLFVALVGLNARAQDNVTLPTYTCTAEDYAAVTKLVAEQLATLTQPDAQPAQAMLIMRATLDTYQAKCTGGTFTNVTNPTGIVGPVVFDGTIYQATLTLPEGENIYGSASLTTIEGDCGYGTFISPATTGGSETELMKFGGDCVALFEVNTEQDWTLTFAKVK